MLGGLVARRSVFPDDRNGRKNAPIVAALIGPARPGHAARTRAKSGSALAASEALRMRPICRLVRFRSVPETSSVKVVTSR